MAEGSDAGTTIRCHGPEVLANNSQGKKMRICAYAGWARLPGRALAGTVIVLASGGFAAQASAATIAVNRPCYVNLSSTRAAPMTVIGSGFVPGDMVLVQSSDGSVNARTTASLTGTIGVTTAAPTPFIATPGPKSVSLTAKDFTATGATISAATSVTSTLLDVQTKPSSGKLTQKVTWLFSGFRSGKQIFGHYLRRRQVARQRFGKAKGPCGVLKVRARFYPGGHPRYHSYQLQLDDSRKYSPHASPRVTVRISTFAF